MSKEAKRSTNQKLKYTFVIAVIVIIIIAVILWSVSCVGGGLKTNTYITINGETSKTLKAEIGGFYPGKTEKYTITVSGNAASSYYLALRFRDDVKGDLEKYITVEIATKEKKVEKTLQELLKGDEVMLGQNANEIEISYVMPEDVGNEAQGTSAVFYIDLTARLTQQS